MVALVVIIIISSILSNLMCVCVCVFDYYTWSECARQFVQVCCVSTVVFITYNYTFKGRERLAIVSSLSVCSCLLAYNDSCWCKLNTCKVPLTGLLQLT